MSEFTINIKPIKNEKENIDSVRKTIQKSREQVDSIANNLSLSGSAFGQVQNALRNIVNTLDSLNKSTVQLGNGLDSIVNLYETTENNIKGTTVNTTTSQTSEGAGNPADNTSSNCDASDRPGPGRHSGSTHGRGGRGRGGGSGGGGHKPYTYSEYNISVPIRPEYLSKDECLEMAERIIEAHGEDGMCNNMDATRIAKELYFHAVLYYATGGPAMEGIEEALGENADILLSKHADPADIGLGDDLDVYYDIFWGWHE